jgi:D-alanyl-D-alanine carboxypeptidase
MITITDVRIPASILIFLFALVFVGTDTLRSNADPRGSMDTGEIAVRLQALLDDLIDTESEDPIHNALLFVQCPGIQWRAAAGMADGDKEVMTPDHKFKIASIAKTFTATVVLQLIEEGLLDLDDTLDKFFSAPEVDLDNLLIYEGISYGPRITIEQLLGHTSGIRCYISDDERFIQYIIEHPITQWTTATILAKYFEYELNTKSSFPPGEGFEYSDTNYLVLAMIIEKVTDSPLHTQYTTRIFNPLGMDNSYLEFYEAPRGEQPLSHAFLGTMDISLSVNTSFDWGGGGLVSTCEELNTFYRALLKGLLFEHESTLQQMLAAADRGCGGMDYDYGYGIMKRTISGLTFYGHGGAYDCDVFYCPDEDISVITALNQMNTHGKRDKFLQQAVDLIK